MRTIKFRGRHLCGQWYYGNLIVRETDSPVPETPQAYKCVMIGDVEDGSAEEVEEDTIGQFTGLKDCNGNDININEGDILRSPSGNIVAVEFGYKEHIVKHGWPNITDSFACYGWIARNVKKGITDFFDNEFAAGEVIGNIHDNPELLKGGEKWL